MTIYAAGSGKAVSNYGQGEIQYDPSSGSFTRFLAGNGYLVGQNDEKYDSIKSEYLARYGSDPTAASGGTAQTSSGLSRRISSRPSYTPPDYTSPYQEQLDTALSQVTAPPVYDKAEYGFDDLYGAYKKSYLREGQRATANAISQAAALSGGVPSTAAVTAATQAGDNYAAALSDLVPQLEATAYSRYQDTIQQQADALERLLAADDRAYQRFSDQRELDYQLWQDSYQGDLQALAALSDLENSAYQRTQTQTKAQNQQLYDLAKLAAQYGDLSYLQQLGIEAAGDSGQAPGSLPADGAGAEGAYGADNAEAFSLWLSGLDTQPTENGQLRYALTSQEDIAIAQAYCQATGLPFLELFQVVVLGDTEADLF